MLALAAAFVFQTSTLPEKAVVDYSGIPSIHGANITIQSHSVTLLIAKDHVDVSSLTLVKNNGSAGTASISIPSSTTGSSAPGMHLVSATWANAPMSPMTSGGAKPEMRLSGSGSMQNLGTYALRISYTVPLGKCGFDHKQLITAYNLASDAPIGTLMVTYSYGPGVVFHEPEAGPNLGWQIGLKGAFVKLTNYDGKSGLSYCAFYPGGFKSIG